jgi:hypothetical protein
MIAQDADPTEDFLRERRIGHTADRRKFSVGSADIGAKAPRSGEAAERGRAYFMKSPDWRPTV